MKKCSFSNLVGTFLKKMIFLFYVSGFFRLHQNVFFIGILAVRVRAIIQLAKIFWSRKDEIFYSFFFLVLWFYWFRKQESEVESLLGINIPYCS